MSLNSSEMRKAWKEYEAAPEKMVQVSIDRDVILVAPETKDAWKALNSILKSHGYSVRPEKTASYADRDIAGTNLKSLHAYGVALDINWDTNPVKTNPQSPVRFSNATTQEARAADVLAGRADTDMKRQMVDDILAIRTKSGLRAFEWGGNWRSKIDTMHYEIDVGPDDLESGINQATVRIADTDEFDPHAVSSGMGSGVAAFGPADSSLSVAGAETVWTEAFLSAHIHIEKWEGGFVHHPDDPGGATNFGITRATLAAWRGHPVSVDDVRNLTRAEARRIFFARFWRPMRLDEIPWPAALMTYNAGVNSGPSRGGRLLQQALNRQGAGVSIDGAIGPQTIGAASNANIDRLVRDFSAIHEAFYRSLSTFPTFGNGWLNRLRDITSVALSEPQAEVKPISAVAGIPAFAAANFSALASPPATSPDDKGTATQPANRPACYCEMPNMTAIDTALGGRNFVGKKTLIAGIAAVLLPVLKKLGIDIDQEMTTILATAIAAYGGLGIVSKVERTTKNKA